MTRIWYLMATGAALLALGACGGSEAAGPAPGGGNTAIVVGNNFFTPTARTVTNATTVNWAWAAGSVLHNVTFDDGPASSTQSAGTYARTFTASGTFPYHCTIHGTSMAGTIVVQ